MNDHVTNVVTTAATGATTNSNAQEDITMFDTTVQEAATTNSTDHNAIAVDAIVNKVTSTPFATPVAVETALPTYDADYIKMILAERDAAMKLVSEYKKQEQIEKENFELRERYRKEPRAISTRNTLVLRRTPNHDKIAPVRDVLDYIEYYDIKAEVTADKKKIRVSDEEIKVYQDLKAEGAKNITQDMVKQIIEAKGGKTDGEDDLEQDEASAMA